jgi:hypothetical protein
MQVPAPKTAAVSQIANSEFAGDRVVAIGIARSRPLGAIAVEESTVMKAVVRCL